MDFTLNCGNCEHFRRIPQRKHMGYCEGTTKYSKYMNFTNRAPICMDDFPACEEYSTTLTDVEMIDEHELQYAFTEFMGKLEYP